MIQSFIPKPVWLLMVAVLIAVAAVWATSYHTWEFKGGEAIRDSGFFFYPRYHAQLGRLALWEAGEYQFTARGLPQIP